MWKKMHFSKNFQAHALVRWWFQITLQKENVFTTWLITNNLKYFLISHTFINKCFTQHIWKQLATNIGTTTEFCITWYEFDYKHWALILREVKSKFWIHKIWKPFNLIWKAKHKSFVDVNVTDRKRSCNHFQSSEYFIYVKPWYLHQA